ncbi:cyclopropane fatty acyl phospholipid synthase [Lysobacter auxotrophicus]|uniref:Cyclopropane fatty acyl phospholipid synthase n=1 Tax=Lysobacter auxotrophicus TaxID=2992573 RepID=A0ABM8DEN8_9GAMM|nr:cyclopropane fatty acyl phospholipid synthase [Lysobacter auxotrophicus]BDU17031.1 cyclopropane fatty acyl phospholipid synthase [Lysobacter auxotrophicus]
MSALRSRVEQLLSLADVRLDGDRPWDLHVEDERFHARVLSQGSLGLGESYMDGWWRVPSLDGMLYRMLTADLDQKVRGIGLAVDALRARLTNLQSRRRSFQVGERHYDLGNDLYRAMLGKRLVYSCAYWRDRDGQLLDHLDDAQEAKLDLVCRKLGLQPGMKVLDIGCGWGEALKFAAERYGIRGVGVTVSREQAAYARELCKGLPIEIRLQDYRALGTEGSGERFDRSFSLGMFEHVGVKNYRTYFEVAQRCLVDDGLFLLHTIGTNRSVRHTDPWIGKYIFPNSMLPSAAQIAQASEGLFVLEDWHNFGADYDRTLQAWRANVERAWPQLDARYDERFRRMWRFYLSASMATFRSRHSQLWQLVLSPKGVPGGYVAPR